MFNILLKIFLEKVAKEGESPVGKKNIYNKVYKMSKTRIFLV